MNLPKLYAHWDPSIGRFLIAIPVSYGREEPISHRYSAFSDQQPKHAVYLTPVHEQQTQAIRAAAN